MSAVPVTVALEGGSFGGFAWGILAGMRGLGHAAAAGWLYAHLPAVGHRSTADAAGLARPQGTKRGGWRSAA